MALNVVLLPPFLTEAAILDGEIASANLHNIFAKCISKKGMEEEEEKFAEDEED